MNNPFTIREGLYWRDGSLNNAVGSMYSKIFFNLDSKRKVDLMVENIKAEFKNILEELDWMDSKTKEKGHAKV